MDHEGKLQNMEDYTPTANSYFEVYYGTELFFKSQLNPSTWRIVHRGQDEIECYFSSSYGLVAKSGSNWSNSTTYKVILTGMLKNG